MSAMRDELHGLVDELPEEELGQAIAQVRQSIAAAQARGRAAARLERAQQRMLGARKADTVGSGR